MRNLKAIFTAFVLVVLCATAMLAAETPPAPAAKKDAVVNETAVFAVPGLDKGTAVKDLSKAVAEKPGVVAAQADKEKGKFSVTFEPGKTNPEEIQKALAAVNPAVKLDKVGPADAKAAKHDCGKCPSKSTCGKKK